MSLQVLVNITLTYDIRENKIYEQCKGLIQFNFEQSNFQVTAPFIQQFSPLGCPTISTSNGAVLADEEYFCTTGKKIKFQPEGYTSPIDVCGKMLSFPLHGAFQLSMIGILNLGCSMASSPSLLFVFLHSFVFSLYSYIHLYSNLSWDFLRVHCLPAQQRCAVRPGVAGACAVSSCPSFSWCSPTAVSPSFWRPSPRGGGRKGSCVPPVFTPTSGSTTLHHRARTPCENCTPLHSSPSMHYIQTVIMHDHKRLG